MINSYKERVITKLFKTRNSWLEKGVILGDAILIDSHFLDLLESIWFSEIKEKELAEVMGLIKNANVNLSGGDA